MKARLKPSRKLFKFLLPKFKLKSSTTHQSNMKQGSSREPKNTTAKSGMRKSKSTTAKSVMRKPKSTTAKSGMRKPKTQFNPTFDKGAQTCSLVLQNRHDDTYYNKLLQQWIMDFSLLSITLQINNQMNRVLSLPIDEILNHHDINAFWLH